MFQIIVLTSERLFEGRKPELSECRQNNYLKHCRTAGYFSPLNPTGAHISVIYPDEEIGQSFNFEVTRFLSLRTVNKRYYALTVSSANLLALRHKYHLGSLLNYRGLLVPFHITIAVSFSLETTNAHY